MRSIIGGLENIEYYIYKSMRTLAEIALVVLVTVAIFVTGFCVPEFGVYSIYSGIGVFIIGLFIVYCRVKNRNREAFQELFIDRNGRHTYETL